MRDKVICVRFKTVYKYVFFVGLALALTNIAADFLKHHLSTTSPTATNTLAYVEHGRTYYMPPIIALWSTRLMVSYFSVFAVAMILAAALMLRERAAKNACPKSQAPAQ